MFNQPPTCSNCKTRISQIPEDRGACQNDCLACENGCGEMVDSDTGGACSNCRDRAQELADDAREAAIVRDKAQDFNLPPAGRMRANLGPSGFYEVDANRCDWCDRWKDGRCVCVACESCGGNPAQLDSDNCERCDTRAAEDSKTIAAGVEAWEAAILEAACARLSELTGVDWQNVGVERQCDAPDCGRGCRVFGLYSHRGQAARGPDDHLTEFEGEAAEVCSFLWAEGVGQ